MIASQTSLKNNNFGNAGTKYCQTTGTLVPVVVKIPGKGKTSNVNIAGNGRAYV